MNLAPDLAALIPFRRDFEYYAPRCLKILDKQGRMRPFLLNRAQAYVHQKLEEQYNRMGRIRALVLKGRQQGMSTYIGGRFYWRVSGESGRRAFIMTHRDDATANLFLMTKRYHENCPAELRPHTGYSNRQELVFDKLGSTYSLATAGSTGGTGRSATAQFFHGSEMAFWKNAKEHLAGIGQTIPEADGTEIIYESTANGYDNEFFRYWDDAIRGENDYVPIFVPWTWQDEYSREVPDGFTMSAEEEEYAETYEVTPEQMAWRRNKIAADFRGDEDLFNQEYPASPELAFQRVDGQTLIKSGKVVRAAKPKPDLVMFGPLVMGVDPSEGGEDAFAVTLRQGPRVWWTKRRYNIEAQEGANWVGHLANIAKMEHGEPVASINVDWTGLGNGVYSLLKAQKYPVKKVIAGERALEQETYMRVGDEMWGRMRDWLNDEPVEIPDDPVLRGDLISRCFQYDASSRIVLESKDKLRREGKKSPDSGDSLALTFAVSIAPPEGSRRKRVDHGRKRNPRV